MSHVGSSGQKVTPACRDMPGLSWDVPHGIFQMQVALAAGTSQNCLGASLMGSSRHQVTLACRDVPGLSWDVPCGILRTPAYWDVPGVSGTGFIPCPIIPFVPDSPRHPIMSGQSWNMSDTCRQHWTSLDMITYKCFRLHDLLPSVTC